MVKTKVDNSTEEVVQPKRGVLRRLFRRNKAKNAEKPDKRDRTPSPAASAEEPERDDVPEMHPDAKLSSPPKNVKPTARQAAFSGPPRYNWADIETAAAIRLQSAYRRSKVMEDLEREGKTTAAIRNRRNRLDYERSRKSNDISSLLACCGSELLLSEWSQDQYEAKLESEKTAYEAKKKAKMNREEQLRNSYGKILRKKKRNQGEVDEAYEVVE